MYLRTAIIWLRRIAYASTVGKCAIRISFKHTAIGSSRIVYTIIVRRTATGQVLWVRQHTVRGMMQVRFFWLTPPSFDGIRTIVDIARQATRFPVLSSRFSVPGSQFSVLSSQFPVLSSRFSVLSSQFSVLSSRFLVLSSHSPTTAIAAPSTLPVFGRAHQVLPGCSRYAS
jgi:hypothetical protein